MHMRRTNLSPCSSSTVSAVGESLSSVFWGNPWTSLQACSQLRHPMHFVMSTRMAFVRSIAFSFSYHRSEGETPLRQAQARPSGQPTRCRRYKSCQKEFFCQFCALLCGHAREQAVKRLSAVGCHGGRELRHHSIQAREAVLQPGRDHSTLYQVLLIDVEVGRLHDGE